MWDRGGFPHYALMYKSSVDAPADKVGTPFYFVSMEFRRGVESQVDEGWCASVAIFQLGSFASRVVVYVDEQLRRVFPQELKIDFLSRRIAVQENPRDQPRYVLRPYLGHETAVQVTPPTGA